MIARLAGGSAASGAPTRSQPTSAAAASSASGATGAGTGTQSASGEPVASSASNGSGSGGGSGGGAARRRSRDATAEGSSWSAAAATATVAAAASSALPATASSGAQSRSTSPLPAGYSAAAMAAMAAAAAQSIAAVARSSSGGGATNSGASPPAAAASTSASSVSSPSPSSGSGSGSNPALQQLVAALASGQGARASGGASPASPSAAQQHESNLSELLETVKTMSAGRVFTGYFANQSLQEPIKQDLFVFFDRPLPQGTQEQAPPPTPVSAPSVSDKKKGSSASSTPTSSTSTAPSSFPATAAGAHAAAVAGASGGPVPPGLSGGVLYWSVVGRDGSLHRTRSADLSLSLEEIDDIYLGKRTTAFTLPFAGAAREECCFSLIARNRTHMNFEAKTPVTLVSWLLGLKRLVQANKKIMEPEPLPSPASKSTPMHAGASPISVGAAAVGSHSGSQVAPPASSPDASSPSSPLSWLTTMPASHTKLRWEIWHTVQHGIQQGVQLFQAAIAQQKAQQAAAAAAASPPPVAATAQPAPKQAPPPPPQQPAPKQAQTQPASQKQSKHSNGSSGGFLSNLLGGKHNNSASQQQQQKQKQQQQQQPQQQQPQPQRGNPSPGPRSLTSKALQQNNPSQMAAAAFVAAANAQQQSRTQVTQHVRSRSSVTPGTYAGADGSSGGGCVGGSNGAHALSPVSGRAAEAPPSVDPLQLFQILGRIGQGNYGYVYKARDLRDNQLVAIKIVEVDSAASSAELSAEISILSRCHSGNIVAYKGTFTRSAVQVPAGGGVGGAMGAGGATTTTTEKKYSPNSTLTINPQQVWIVMEYCVAGSLCDLMAITDRVLSEEQIAAVLKMSLQGLAYFHSLRHLHRDIKAGNILVNHEGIAKLSDFGVSAQLSASVNKRQTVTGSLYWMAPEVMTSSSSSSTPSGGGGPPYNEKADIWSLGATAIELATGDPPHHNLHPMKALFAIPNMPPPRLPREGHDGTPTRWSDAFHDFVAACLQKDPERRPSAQQLLERHPFITRAQGPSLIKQLVVECMPEIDKYREIEARMANKVSFNRARAGTGGGGDYSDSESSVSMSGQRSISRSWYDGGYAMRNAQSISDLRGLAASVGAGAAAAVGNGGGGNARSPQAALGGYASQRASRWEKELSRSERDKDRVRREREWEQELSRGRAGTGGEESQRSQSPSFSYSTGGNHLSLPTPWNLTGGGGSSGNGGGGGVRRNSTSRGTHLPPRITTTRGQADAGGGAHLASYDSAGLTLYEGQGSADADLGAGSPRTDERSISFSMSQSLYQNRYGTASSNNGGLPFYATMSASARGSLGGDGSAGLPPTTASSPHSDDMTMADTPERARCPRSPNGDANEGTAANATNASPSFNTLYRKAAVEAVRHAEAGDFYTPCGDDDDADAEADGDDGNGDYSRGDDSARARGVRRGAFLDYEPFAIPTGPPLHAGPAPSATTGAALATASAHAQGGSNVWEYAPALTEAAVGVTSSAQGNDSGSSSSAHSASAPASSGIGGVAPLVAGPSGAVLPPVPLVRGSSRLYTVDQSSPSSASLSQRASPSPLVSAPGSVGGSHQRQGSASTSLTAALSALQPFSLSTASPSGPLPAPAALVANVPPIFVDAVAVHVRTPSPSPPAPTGAHSGSPHTATTDPHAHAYLQQPRVHRSPTASPSQLTPPQLHEAPPSPMPDQPSSADVDHGSD